LQVQPSFSTTDAANTVAGIPGLQTRAVETNVDLREGQWLAIAGLVQDQQEGGKTRVPAVGDIPYVGTLFGRRHVKRDETELLVLVSPELVHPLEAEECPLILPGMEVTEPNDWAFYLAGEYEGPPDRQHRSTVAHVSPGAGGAGLGLWAAGSQAAGQPTVQPVESGATAHVPNGSGVGSARWAARTQPSYQAAERRYVQGPHGFSQ
jgi:Flp pilus assembly secretin CpaC